MIKVNSCDPKFLQFIKGGLGCRSLSPSVIDSGTVSLWFRKGETEGRTTVLGGLWRETVIGRGRRDSLFPVRRSTTWPGPYLKVSVQVPTFFTRVVPWSLPWYVSTGWKTVNEDRLIFYLFPPEKERERGSRELADSPLFSWRNYPWR